MFTVSLAPAAKSETLGERKKRKAAKREGSLGNSSPTSSPELSTSQEKSRNSTESFAIIRSVSRTKSLLKISPVSEVSVNDFPSNKGCGRRNNSQDSGYSYDDDEFAGIGVKEEDNLTDFTMEEIPAINTIGVTDPESAIHPGRRVSISQFPSPPLTGAAVSENNAPKVVPYGSPFKHTQTWPLSFSAQKNFSTPTGECPYAKKYFSQDTVFSDEASIPEQTQEDSSDAIAKALQDMMLRTPEEILDGLRDVSNSSNQDEINFNQRIWLRSAVERLRVHAGLSTRSFGNRILCLHDSVADSYFTAAQNPSAVTQGISPKKVKLCQPASLSSARWPSLHNLSYLTRVGAKSTAVPLPYSDNFFDSIYAHALPAVLQTTDWPFCLKECLRVLKPRGKLWIEFVDPMPLPMGPLIQRRAVTAVIDQLEKNGRSTRPGLLVPQWLKEAGFLNVNAERLPLPAVNTRGGWNDELEAKVGRMLYRSLYEQFAPCLQGGNGVMLWEEEALVQECRNMGTAFEMTSVSCEKP